MFPLLIRRVSNPRAFGSGSGEEVNPPVFLVFQPVSAHPLPPLSSLPPLPPLFLETSHSRESGPSCSQRLGLASSRFLLLLLLCLLRPPPSFASASVSAVYGINEERRGRRARRKPSSFLVLLLSSSLQTFKGDGPDQNSDFAVFHS